MSSMTSDKAIAAFRRTVWKHYKEHGRHTLPWRKTIDPYRILVSEVMLQQTQVPRVIEKYKEFLKEFPSVQALAKASLGDVLKVWSGLGYNRRGKYLHDAAVSIVEEHGGKFPREYPSLRAIPGVGQYTANAVRVFAFNESEILVETNVRTAIIHHFFPGERTIKDTEIEKLAAKVAVGQDPREWHSALFDYGAYLKQSGIRTNNRTTAYTKQAVFKGSLREVRGTILKELHKTDSDVFGLHFEKKRIITALASLARDGLVKKEKGKWRVA